MRILRQLIDESGQVVLVAALCMVVLIGFVGIAVDVGYLRFEKRRLQAAADAAALAAALEVRVCGATPNCGAMQTAATTALTENGYSGATFRSACTASTASALTLTLNNPACLVPTDPNLTKNAYVEAVVSEKAQGYFSRVLGFTGFQLSARAEAAHGLGGPCIYALNPTASGALNIAVGLGFKSNCSVVVESSSSTSVNCLLGLGITAPEVQVSPTGGGASLLCLGSTHVTQLPVPVPADPLAYLPPPPTANDACGTSTGSPYTGSAKPVTLLIPLLANIVFNPGVYCGGISITASLLSTITFNPGTYIIRNYQGPAILGITPSPVGGFTITIGVLSTMKGNGVTFYNEGNAGGFSLTTPSLPLGLSNFNMSAPTSGNYGGILFFQAHGVTNTGTYLATLLGASGLNGVIYEPDAMVTYGVAAISTAGSYNGIVADKIQFNVNVLSTFANDFSTLQTGSPINGDHATLVQ
jgi:Flp pilus assembly protein TadG